MRSATRSKVFFFVSCQPAPSSFFMGREARKGSKQTALTGSGFWPMLSKPAIAIGKHSTSLVRNVSDDEDDDGPELTTDKSDTDLGLLDPSGDSEGYLVQAASGAIEL